MARRRALRPSCWLGCGATMLARMRWISALAELEAEGAVVVRENFCADPHLAEVDLRVIALIDTAAVMMLMPRRCNKSIWRGTSGWANIWRIIGAASAASAPRVTNVPSSRSFQGGSLR